MTPAAIVLCGGRSQRMGQPKAWLPFGPEPLLVRVVRLLAGSARPVVVVAAPEQDLPDLPAGSVIVRDIAEGLGPLAALEAGLEAVGDGGLAYATATDAPFLGPGWIGRLAALIGDADLAIPRHDGRLHPLAALYRTHAVLPIVKSLRDRGQQRLLDLVEAAAAREVGADELRVVDPDLISLRNINTPDEYRAALLLAGRSDEFPPGPF
jgi:molybdopterin-guanine dinucleotide biosynthesis protein A